METVRSADGTTIAFDRLGEGPALVMVLGAFNDRHTKSALGALLSPHFTVVSYDRRGRGDSGDTPPYAVDREIDDLAAVIAASGGPAEETARVFGHSSGAVLGLEAAARGIPIGRLAVYEPPVAVIDGTPEPSDLAARVRAEVTAGRRGEAAKLFLTEGIGMPAEVVAMIEASPGWPGMEAIAHTLPYDLTITACALSPARLATIPVPTLAVNGGASPGWMDETAAAIATAVPDAKHVALPGQTHDEDPTVLAPVLAEFLA
ncbi:MAG TPA: alpha/beta hydrolase [Acidimicrobiales bacterium]|nr:alpha/beta hydrolase [Acidimicrobiales bacterium]